MHISTKLPERLRRELYGKYISGVKIQLLVNWYHLHRNTISKVIKRWKQWDFTVHTSCREDYKSLKYWLKKLDVLHEKIQKKILKYGSIQRYEKEHAWDLGHIDVHKLKNVAWQNPKKKKYHAWLLDDATRICYSEVLPDKKAKTLAWFLRRACLRFKTQWITFKAILSDNWKEFTTHWEQWKEKHIFTRTCVALWIKQKFTRVRRPQTNWKIERFRRTSQTERFRKVIFLDWQDVTKSLETYMQYYNYTRIHWSLWAPPILYHQQKILSD